VMFVAYRRARAPPWCLASKASSAGVIPGRAICPWPNWPQSWRAAKPS